ncbi:MAG TPA: hypothetical protein VGE51_14570 [Fontimonas sp.]
METYSVGVALFDFLPVFALTAGLIPLARVIAVRVPRLAELAWCVALLIPLGGFCKASWKLNMALTQQDIGWLESLLFICLAPGFVGLAYCFFHARRAWEQGLQPDATTSPAVRLLLWLALPLIAGVAAALIAPGGRLWFFVLLGITTVANAALLWQAIAASRRGGLHWRVAACFIYNFAATLALSGLSRLPAGESSAWLQEGINLSAQLALATGFIHLARRMRERF